MADINGTDAAQDLSGTNADDRLYGLGGKDRLYAKGGNDQLYGGAGNDQLDGAAGADTMFGGSGNDTYRVDNAGDVVSEETVAGVDDGGIDTVQSSITFCEPHRYGGQATQAIAVTINGDAAFEGDEIFFVNLTNGTNGGTIVDGLAGSLPRAGGTATADQ